MTVQVASADPELEQDYASPDNFYGILGVPENASRRDIKRAYKAMMKDFHPDLSGDEESTEFCILLNEIYEVGAKYLLMAALPFGTTSTFSRTHVHLLAVAQASQPDFALWT